MMNGNPTPTDWTSGTGTISAGGTLTISAEPSRQGIFVQNQDTAVVKVQFTSQSSSGSATTSTILLAADTGTGAGKGGELALSATDGGVFTSAAFSVVGTAGKQVCVLTF